MVNTNLEEGLHKLKNKSYQAAISCFNQVLSSDCDNYDALIGKAYCFYGMKHKSFAIKLCVKVHRDDLNEPFLSYYDEMMGVRRNSSSRTKSPNSNSSRSSSKSINKLLVKGRGLIRNRDFINAFSIYEEALKLDSSNTDAIVGYSYCFLHLGYSDHAQAICKGLSADNLRGNNLKYYKEIMGLENSNSRYVPPNPSSFSSGNKEVQRLCDDGFKYIDMYKVKDAKICFNKALKLDPNNPRAIYGNAVCLYNLGYYILALNECERALKIDRNSVDRNFYQKVKLKTRNI